MRAHNRETYVRLSELDEAVRVESVDHSPGAVEADPYLRPANIEGILRIAGIERCGTRSSVPARVWVSV